MRAGPMSLPGCLEVQREVGGRGGSCFGDSGGPVFVNDTNQVLAVVSYGPSGTCHGADYSWRVDTVDAHGFVAGFLD